MIRAFADWLWLSNSKVCQDNEITGQPAYGRDGSIIWAELFQICLGYFELET